MHLPSTVIINTLKPRLYAYFIKSLAPDKTQMLVHLFKIQVTSSRHSYAQLMTDYASYVRVIKYSDEEFCLADP